LNIGLYRPENSLRWVFIEEVDGAERESERHFLGLFNRRAVAASMPSKGEVCPLGEYAGSLTARYRSAGSRVSLPKEARRILRNLDSASPELRLAFDRGARLYQLGAVIGGSFPSAGLAYRVAALDAISGANGRKEVLLDFTRRYTAPSLDLEQLIDYLWGSVRSAHFHGGEFPLGEFSPVRFFEPFMDSVETTQVQIHRLCYELTREAIVRWIDNELARAGAAEDAETLNESI